jgi:DNA helicase II / ATP-dependent DNA helicase PcrA
LKPSEIDRSELRDSEDKLFPAVYERYQSKLEACQAVDFDDLLFLTVRLFKEHPEVLRKFQERWQFVLVDEYQDTNAAQYTLTKYLVEKSQNICVVGDPDQSIYSWRGANIKNILNFEKDFPGAKTVRLEQNYRSRSNILEAANALISYNTDRLEKNLWSSLGPGEKIKFFVGDTDRSEANFVVDRILHHHTKLQIPLNQMVIFYRTNSQSRIFEDYFLSKRIPYVIVGGLSFYQRREIKDILAFLRMVFSGSDLVSFERTINLPKRGIGGVTLEKIRLAASQENLTIFGYCEALVDERSLQYPVKLPPKQKEGLRNYVALIRELRTLNEATTVGELVKAAIEQSGYLALLREDPETMNDRKENLDALIAKAMEWEISSENPTLTAFLEELSLKSSLDEAQTDLDRVSLMTIHNGKGLEFTVTFLVGMEEQLFPHVNSRESQDQLEEERRLCYVGMTRAKEYLYMTRSQQRYLWGVARVQHPSRFLNEIPFEYVERVRLGDFYEERIQKPAPAPRRFQTEWRMAEMPEPEEVRHIEERDQTVPDHEPLEVSDAVYHVEFGVGVIKQIMEGSLGLTYKIHFSKDNRERSIVAKFAHLKKL